MATRTVTLPSGRKARTQSQRRYVLFIDVERTDSVLVRRRSDSLNTALRVFMATGYREGETRHLVDTSTGEIVKADGPR